MTSETTWTEIRRVAIRDAATRTWLDPHASDDAREGAKRELLAAAPVDERALAATLGGMPPAAYALLREAVRVTRETRKALRDEASDLRGSEGPT